MGRFCQSVPRYYSDTHFSDPSTAELKMKSVYVGFLLTLMIGDIVGPGGGNDDDKEPPQRFSDEEVHFSPDHGIQRQRQGRQSMLRCMMGCTRELRPVRGEQGGDERLFPNKCAFNIENCRARVQRKPQLVLSSDQSGIHWPTVN